MSYTDKLAQISALIENYNKAVDEGEDGRIDVNAFVKCLKKKGVIDEATLAYAKYEIFEDCGLPRIQSEMAANIARTSANPQGTDKPFVNAKKAERMNVRELVEAYDPTDKLGNPVTNRLKAITEGRKVVVFRANGSLYVEATVSLINEKIDGFPERETYEVDGRPQPLFAIGEHRGDYLDENPIFVNEPLRLDGTCGHTDRSWEDVPMVVRQLVHLAFHVTGEAPSATNDNSHVHWVLDYISSMGADNLRKRWKKASVLLDEQIAEGHAPLLRVRLGGSASKLTKKNDPFFGQTGHRQY